MVFPNIMPDLAPIGPEGPEILWPFFIVFEGLVLGLLLSRHGFRFIRVFIVWPFITLLTYIFFAFAVLFTASLTDHWVIVGSSIVIGELLVILVESVAIQSLSTRAFFRKGGKAKLGLRPSLYCSLIVNMSSLVGCGALPWIFIAVGPWT